MTTEQKCRWCGGKGRVPAHWFGAKKTCPECLGTGRISTSDGESRGG